MPSDPFGGDTEDLTPAACCMADAEGWDLNGLRDRLGEDVTEYARELPLSVLVRSDWHHPRQRVDTLRVRNPTEHRRACRSRVG
jgi:hypothetical protein